MLNFIKKFFRRKNIENKDYFIPVTEQERNNPNIKKVFVGGLTIDEVKKYKS